MLVRRIGKGTVAPADHGHLATADIWHEFVHHPVLDIIDHGAEQRRLW